MKAAREKAGLTQVDLARQMGLEHRQTLAAIEAGERRLSADELLRAMEILRVDLDYFTDSFRLVGAEGRFSFRAQRDILPALLDAFEERGERARLPDIYDPSSYTASQRLGRALRDAGSNGIAFESVRRAGGECVAVFRPRLVQNVRQSVHLRYAWDGNSIAHVYEMRALNL